jgi:hypothetical protein
MEGPVTSLSAWEQQVLNSIKDGLASSDPTLVARLAIFTRLASGEQMAAREKIHVGSQLAACVLAPNRDIPAGRRWCRRCCGW